MSKYRYVGVAEIKYSDYNLQLLRVLNCRSIYILHIMPVYTEMDTIP